MHISLTLKYIYLKCNYIPANNFENVHWILCMKWSKATVKTISGDFKFMTSVVLLAFYDKRIFFYNEPLI